MIPRRRQCGYPDLSQVLFKFNINRWYGPTVAPQQENYLADRTTNTLSNRPENIDESWAAGRWPRPKMLS